MKRGLVILLAILLLSTAVAAQIHVFYLPENGFIRVSGELNLDPADTSLSFALFPAAHLTELWSDDLLQYRVQKEQNRTIVSIELRQAVPQTLSFSYEGLVDPEDELAALGPAELWLPQFPQPLATPSVTLQLPLGWKVVDGAVLESWQQGEFQLIQLAPSPAYPSLTLAALSMEPPLDLAEQRETLAEASLEPMPELTADLTPEPAPVSLPEQTPAQGAVQEEQDRLARIEIQINRLTRALSSRSEEELAELLSPELQEQGLAPYLAGLPEELGRVKSEILQSPEEPGGEFTVLFTTDGGARFAAATTWQEGLHGYQLRSFRLTPHQEEIPWEVQATLEEFASQLQLGVEMEDRGHLTALLSPNPAQDREEILQFLLSLDSTRTWTLEYVNLEPFAITVLVPHREGGQFLLHLDLIPGEHHWLLHSLQVFPL